MFIRMILKRILLSGLNNRDVRVINDYLLAWLIYLVAGCLMAVVVWRVTSRASYSWRALLRGTYLVITFTPWVLIDYPGFYAPAFIILIMDMLLKGSGNSLSGGLALLGSFTFMLIFLSFRALKKSS